MTQETDIEGLWENVRRAIIELKAADENYKMAREALVSRICICYRAGENWENRAVWCSERLLGKCRYYNELKRRNL